MQRGGKDRSDGASTLTHEMNEHYDAALDRNLSGALEALRKRLVDTGTRNRLVHVNRNAKRANVLNVVLERSDDIYDLLRVKERKMRFRARGEDEPDPEPDDMPFELDEEEEKSRHRDAYLETELGPQALEKRLLKLYRDSKSSEEEQGANFLYLALGFLRWYEDGKSAVLREAPLVLLPVQLNRLQRGFTFNLAARPDDVTTNLPLQQRLMTDFGIALPEIDDSEQWTPGSYFDRVDAVIQSKDRWSVVRNGMQLGFFSFAKALMFRDLVEDNWPGGGLTQNPLISGLLDTDREVEGSPLRFGPRERLDDRLDPKDLIHVVEADASQAKVIEEVRSGCNLVVQGPPGTGKSQTIANIIAAAAHEGKTVLFMAEKMAALKVVHDRLVKVGLRELCLELHSRAANKKAFYEELKRTIHAGRAVPETPSDPEALVDARDRLNAIDAGLHESLEGKDYSPFDAIAELCRFLGKGEPPPKLRSVGLAKLTNAHRDSIGKAVRAFAEDLEVAGPPAEHPFFGVRALDLQPTDVRRLKPELGEARDSVVALLQTAGALAQRLGVETALDLAKAERLAQLLGEIVRAPAGVRERAALFAACADFNRLMDGLGRFKTWADARDDVKGEFKSVAWNTRVEELRPQIAAGLGSVWTRWFGEYGSASKQFAVLLKGKLPRSPRDRLTLVDALIAVQRERRALASEEDWLSTVLGSHWQGERTEVAGLVEAGIWVTGIGEALEQIGRPLTVETLDAAWALGRDAEALQARLQEEHERVRHRLRDLNDRLQFDPEHAFGRQEPLEELKDRLARMHDEVMRFEEWRRLEERRRALVRDGLEAFAQRMERDETSPGQAEREFRYAVAEARWDHARSERPGLDEIARLDRHGRVAAFQQLDKQRLEEVRKLVRGNHLAQLPMGASGEMAFVYGELGKKMRHRPVRQAFLAAPNMIPRIKPVILMSPISIAQFLPPERIAFDLLLIDEASQVRPEDALGGVARASQIVVVGDDKQLPPTNFFNRLVDNLYEDEDEDVDAAPTAAGATEMESILKLAEARGLGQAMLEWHYRSRDPSLIKVSNVEFYESGLILPPSPLEKDDRFGMKLTRVPGVYSSRKQGGGRAGTNRIEAECIADALAEHAEATDRQGQSVGVVAFSKAQSDMITEVLEMRRRKNPSLDSLLREGKNEDAFVKNIENVQGDERDVILVSVGYGPHEPNGRLTSMRFGPINNEGGERRLNVLFSRSRMRCEVFVSFDWREIDLKRTKAHGVRILRKFLDYADTGRLGPDPAATGLGPDSPLEEDVAEVIDGFGYPFDYQVGSAGFRIDLGVRHPKRQSQYILAVECDGATYHSALWARERDRLRQQVLEHQGWRFHRIWSTDWFHRREREVERLRTALDRARVAAREGFQPPAANSGSGHTSAASGSGPEPPSPEVPEPPQPQPQMAPAYSLAEATYPNSAAPHELELTQMAALVAEIVEQEGPMHGKLVARRVAQAERRQRTGSSKGARVGSRIVGAVDRALRWAVQHDMIEQVDDFCMTTAQRTDPPVRNRSSEWTSVQERKPANLPPVEICAAAKWVERENGLVQGQERIRAVARLLGYGQVSKQLKAHVQKALEECPERP
ncbi:MAG: DUF3320 domain-containing protein [Rhodobacteraceae bacterium]|nr:DUF3320 domain-containing protein [Paracoccaceae bacterium]